MESDEVDTDFLKLSLGHPETEIEQVPINPRRKSLQYNQPYSYTGKAVHDMNLL